MWRSQQHADRRTSRLFLVLIVAQAAHSVEEYLTRLYDVFRPAHYVSTALGLAPPVGFVLANSALALFGLWCWRFRVRPLHPSARAFAWFWAILETLNGVGHFALAIFAGGYFPGLYTAPLLFGIGGWLALRLMRSG